MLSLVAFVSLIPSQPSTLIRGGQVLDGSGRAARFADVRVKGHTIVAIGSLIPQEGEEVIDATGRIVAPGFIDAHSHADSGLDRLASQFRQGITTAVVGQDGFDPGPTSGVVSRLRAAKTAINFATFAGHGRLRTQAMKNPKQKATLAEEHAMQRALEADMKAGALGLSTGLEYEPGSYATTAEIVGLARVARRFGGMYISHIRDETKGTFAALAEVRRVAEEAKLPGQVSHIKMGVTSQWGRAEEAKKLMADARARGVDMTADVYPYPAWQSTFAVLTTRTDWERQEVWEEAIRENGGAQNILFANYSKDPSWNGKTLAAVAKSAGKPAAIVAREVALSLRNGASASVIVTSMSERDIEAFITDPFVMICSDGAPGGRHPRGAGTFPRVLASYVREKNVLSLPEAVRKMTHLPARRFGFKDRGLILPGMKADIVVFDARTVADRATFSEPTLPPVGISHVLVNGVPVLLDGKVTGARPGQVLLRR